MLLHYTVLFEFATRPALTVQGTVEAKELETGAKRAMLAAQRQVPRLRWSRLSLTLKRDPATGQNAPRSSCDARLVGVENL